MAFVPQMLVTTVFDTWKLSMPISVVPKSDVAVNLIFTVLDVVVPKLMLREVKALYTPKVPKGLPYVVPPSVERYTLTTSVPDVLIIENVSTLLAAKLEKFNVGEIKLPEVPLDAS
jgi:hypothetical protein